LEKGATSEETSTTLMASFIISSSYHYLFYAQLCWVAIFYALSGEKGFSLKMSALLNTRETVSGKSYEPMERGSTILQESGGRNQEKSHFISEIIGIEFL
jgi:hypothetical protein